MMDYDYVNKCSDPAELRAILARLKSGEEGFFPHLNQHVEQRLLALLPDKERRKINTLRAGPRSAWKAMCPTEGAREREGEESLLHVLLHTRLHRATVLRLPAAQA